MKINLKIILLLFVFQQIGFSQSYSKTYLDSLYKIFVGSRTPAEKKINTTESIKTAPVKCGTFMVHILSENINSFTASEQEVLKPLLDRPYTDTSMVTPQNHFRIHFMRSGSDTPKYSLTDLAIALDSAYNFEINYLKYPPPPGDDGAGGDNLYDVYVLSLGSTYGYTNFNQSTDEVSPGSKTYKSYMMIDNAFSSYFYTTGIEGARVTVAHEFHHAIQIGNYIYREEDQFFLELTSTSMEEFVYNSINDYYNYMSTYFNAPWRCFSRNNVGSGDGYDLAIWNLFLKKKYGFDIIKREWELLKNYQAIEAIDKALQEYNTTFVEAYNEFGLWCYFTNYRAADGKYFDEGAHYPLLKPMIMFEYQAPSQKISFNSFAAANNFLYCINTPQIDTMMVVVTNGDVNEALINQTYNPFAADFNLYNYNCSGSSMITSNYYSLLSTTNSFWYQGQVLNNLIVKGDTATTASFNYPFPTPFIYSKNILVYFPITNADVGNADISIYNASMSRVYSGTQVITKFVDKKVVRWDGKDSNGNKLATGVYIYVVKTDNHTITGKTVIINN